MILAIHHAQIGIPADGLAKAREFYCGVLGLKEIHRPFGPDGIWCQVGDRALHIGLDDVPDRRCSNAHVAYQVDDLAEMRRRLAARGVRIDEAPLLPGHERFQIRDPFGNMVEFIQPIAEKA